MNLAKLREKRMKTAHLATPEMKQGIKPGETLTLLDVDGAGQVVRLHITLGFADPLIARKVLLKIHWDGEEEPSILCPVGDFFCDAFCGMTPKCRLQCNSCFIRVERR